MGVGISRELLSKREKTMGTDKKKKSDKIKPFYSKVSNQTEQSRSIFSHCFGLACRF